jgi:hypothetical protein
VALLALVPCLLYDAGCSPAAEPRAERPALPTALAKEVERVAQQLGPGAAGSPLAGVSEALSRGRNWLALARLASARVAIDAGRRAGSWKAQAAPTLPRLEADWRRVGRRLAPELQPPSPEALRGVAPAAVRALAEIALLRVRGNYQGSLDYGRATSPEAGAYYLGEAQAQSELVAFLRDLSRPSPLAAPPLRSIGPELDALERELLAAYRPPASVDRHGELIEAGAALKEARELDVAGLRHGALLRYLQALRMAAGLTGRASVPDPELLKRRLDQLATQLDAARVDQSIGRIFLESAQADLERAPAAEPMAIAPAVAGEVLPRYLAALGPAPARRALAPPEVTVTLLRWPYT